jgi:hypothetical protein
MTAPDDARKEGEIAASFGREMTILEAAERALRRLETDLIWWDSESELRQFATTFLAAVTPLIRAATLEEVAKELDMRAIKPDASCDQFSQGRNHGLQLASKVVRALKE